MKAIVISAFPACGKTTFYQNDKKYKVLDSDSSEFSWIKDEKGNNTDKRNPDFPANYIKHIKYNIDTADIIFVSSHKQTRDAMNEAGIEYYSVYPYNDEESKEAWINRMKNRGNDDKFIKFIDRNWDNFMDEIGTNYGRQLILIDKDQCISDIIMQIFADNARR